MNQISDEFTNKMTNMSSADFEHLFKEVWNIVDEGWIAAISMIDGTVTPFENYEALLETFREGSPTVMESSVLQCVMYQDGLSVECSSYGARHRGRTLSTFSVLDTELNNDDVEPAKRLLLRYALLHSRRDDAHTINHRHISETLAIYNMMTGVGIDPNIAAQATVGDVHNSSIKSQRLALEQLSPTMRETVLKGSFLNLDQETFSERVLIAASGLNTLAYRCLRSAGLKAGIPVTSKYTPTDTYDDAARLINVVLTQALSLEGVRITKDEWDVDRPVDNFCPSVVEDVDKLHAVWAVLSPDARRWLLSYMTGNRYGIDANMA